MFPFMSLRRSMKSRENLLRPRLLFHLVHQEVRSVVEGAEESMDGVVAPLVPAARVEPETGNTCARFLLEGCLLFWMTLV
jgi:hypothetical protein